MAGLQAGWSTFLWQTLTKTQASCERDQSGDQNENGSQSSANITNDNQYNVKQPSKQGIQQKDTKYQYNSIVWIAHSFHNIQ